MPSRYTFSDYSPDWPAAFRREAEELQELFGEAILAVHHIGSTSVPGLAAKPIIDVLPIVRSIVEIDDLTPALRAAGYKAWGEYGLAGRRFFTKDRDAYRTHNIHVYQADNPGIERHLAFCAFLRSHAQMRTDYESLKREAYARHSADIEAYNDGKNAWIKSLEPVALAWYRQRPQ